MILWQTKALSTHRTILATDSNDGKRYQELTKLKRRLIPYNCHSVKNVSKTDLLFPNKKLFRAFSASNSLLSQISGLEYSMSNGILLHMYRNCGVGKDANDIDYIAPLKDLPRIRDAFVKSDKFTTHIIFGRENKIGYELAFYHNDTNIRIDIFSLNVINGTKFTPLWYHKKLYLCSLPNEFEFGYKLKVNGYEFSVLGPIEEYLVHKYGENWMTPIRTKDWVWYTGKLNHQCTKFHTNHHHIV